MLKTLAIFAVFVAILELPMRGQSPGIGVNPCGEQEQEGKNDAAKTNNDQRGTPCSPLVVDVKQAAKTKEETAKEQREKNQKEFIDRWTFYFAFAVAATAVLQVIGIAFQIAIFRKQTAIMEGSLGAIKRQADLMDDTAKRQLRAYLGISKSLVKFTEDGALEAQFHIKNTGQTPAYEVKVWRWAIVREYPLSGPLPHPAITPIRTSGMLSSQDKRIIVAEKFKAPDVVMQAINTPEAAFFVYGEIAYKDVFGDSYTLEYRMIYGGPAGTRTFKDTNGVTCGRLCMDAEGNDERKT